MVHKISDTKSGLLSSSSLLDVVPSIIGLYNVNNGEYVYVNQATKKILGYSPDEFMKGGVAFIVSLVHPDDLEPLTRKNLEALNDANRPASNRRTGDQIINFEYRMRHKNGKWVWLHTDGIVYSRTAAGKVELALNVSINITKRREAEEKLQTLAEQLSVLNSSKDEFVALVSHQLRTPATAVKQYLGLLLEGYSDPLTASQKEILQKGYNNNQRQLHIVDELLQVTQLDLEKIKLKLRKQDINRIVAEAASALSKKIADKQQHLILRLAKGPLLCRVDKNQLSLALENIIENASNYSRDNKPITVSVKRLRHHAQITVKDEGVGVKAEDFPKLYQKFSRIDNPLSNTVNGTGLGLYFCKKIIELHGGDIKLSSEFRKGSSFVISLPLGDK